MHKKYFNGGFGLFAIIVIIALAILAGVAVPKFMKMNLSENVGEDTTMREAEPVTGDRAKCGASCRDQYGGSGSAGFDACMRACEAGGVLREEAACASPGPACPSPQSPVCHNGKWYCREHVGGAVSAGSRVFPETNNATLNYPTDAALTAGACGDPALACESPSTPECKNGKWICIGSATAVN